MLSNHPKGLFVAFFSNMGERFGYYTMLAIFTLYMQAKFGYSSQQAGGIYGFFLFGVYFLPLVGGIVADKLLGYGRTIILGTVVMFVGYLIMAVPGTGFTIVAIGLFVISLGTGFFKGNLQALVGNLYDDPKYSGNRDNAFNVFYMGINIGAFFAPSAASGIGSYIMSRFGFELKQEIAPLAHKFLNNELDPAGITELSVFAHAQSTSLTDLTQFCTGYIDAVGMAYNGAFAIASVGMIVSLAIFVVFKKHLKHADITEAEKVKNKDMQDQLIELTPKQTRDRVIALGLVFFVVMFFWAAFHQNGFTMTIFARDYTVNMVSRLNYIWFDLSSFLPFLTGIAGLVFLLRRTSTVKVRSMGAALLVAGAGVTYWVVNAFDDSMSYSPEIFQHFNPIFIVFLTPVIVGMFTFLRSKGKEPSSPKKIGIGMIITAVGFTLLMLSSFGLRSPAQLDGTVSDTLLSPYWLISTYFTLTVAELFLSPIGISFVSKVAPPKYKGLAQGGWLGATALGNLLAGLFGYVWGSLALWQSFLVLVIACLLAASFIFSVLKTLEKSASS
jgi:POT family proton-dependent oligopeptide transporter